jgi:hypothetical protein
VQLLLSSLVAASVREKISALCFEKKKVKLAEDGRNIGRAKGELALSHFDQAGRHDHGVYVRASWFCVT